MEDKRAYKRKKGSLEVIYQLADQMMAASSHSVNISGAGIRLTIQQRLEPGTTLALEVHSKETGETIKVLGEVVWEKETQGKRFPYEVGVAFTKITPGALETLQDMIKKLGQQDADNIRWF